jgi:hypothetical protein
MRPQIYVKIEPLHIFLQFLLFHLQPSTQYARTDDGNEKIASDTQFRLGYMGLDPWVPKKE